MATKNIGYIVDLTGSAQVRTAEGIIRILNIGDTVSERDVLITGDASNVVIAFYSGQNLQVAENAEVLLDETVFAEAPFYTDDQVDQIAALQQMILEGKDISELDPTAAGNDQSDGLHQTPTYERDGRVGSVDTRPTDYAVDGESFDQQFFGNDALPGVIPQTQTSSPALPQTPADTSASATISINSITADDVVNAAESGGAIDVTGSVGGDAAPGDTVSFTVNGTNYTGSVLAGNTFSIAVAGSDLVADTSFDATVTGSDAAGNPFSATTTSTHSVDTTASASIAVDAITADDIVNATESGAPINVTGSVGGDAAPGDSVSFTINGTNYSGTVAAGNTFSISVAGADLAADTSFDATVTGSDAAGNPFSATTTSTHSVDTTTSATITVDNITADDIVNAAEAAGSINVTGNVGGDAAPGDSVSFTINGTNYNGSVLAGNTFSIAVAGADLAADTSFDATVTGTDGAGNPFSATTTSTHSVDATASATISVDAITADDVVNAAEAGAPINVTGSVGGDAAPGDTVSFTINGTNYSGSVLAGNTFSIAVAGADLAADTSFDATVSGTDGVGNPFSATTTSTHSVDTTASASIAVDTITADDIVNAAEAGAPINVTGSVGGDAAPGDIVSFTINGTNYSGNILAGNTFSIAVAGADLAADTSFDATVTGTDGAGNPFSATTTSTHSVDTSANAMISVDNITADDIVNAAEAGTPINVTGSVGGDAAPGDTVSFTVNGTNYSGSVLAGNTFSIAVAGADLAADTSFDATVTGTDSAGNPFSATTTSIHTVDTTASATINVDTITADDVVNAAEEGAPINVTGSVGGDAAPGDTVSFTINSTNYSGSVLAGNTFSISVAGADLAADTSFDATVTGTDGAGNPFSVTTTSTHTVDTTASATITVDNITADDIVNAAEAAGSINVTGSVGGDAAPGDSVSFTINGTNYSGSVLAGNTFSIAVVGADLAADTSFDATVTGSDAAGNPFSATTTSTHTVDTGASASIAIDIIAGDDIINAIESGNDLDITGTVTGDAESGDTVVINIGGTDYSTTVNVDNTTFSITLPAAAVGALTDGTATATVSGTDAGGNAFSASNTRTYTVDMTTSASISVDAITADDIVNAAEAGAAVNVTGLVGGDAAPGDTVSFTVNGTSYSGVVAAGNTFSISVAGADLATDTSFDATVTGTDSAGNPFSATTTSTHSVDTTASATIAVDTITADDVVNAAEAGGAVNVTGSVGGDAAPGDTVSFTINGTNYSGVVTAGNAFSISVAGADLAADTSFDATVTGTDSAGNPFSATTTSIHSVDTTATASIAVDAITADDIVNAVEAAGSINITGSVGGDAAPGDTVSFTINGTNYSGSVLAGNTFSVSVAGADLAADTSFDATVTGSDAAGNSFSATTTSTHNVDTTASATISVDAITADDIVNAAEAGAPINVTGSVGGDAAPGDTVSFTVNGTDYSGTVAAGNTFSITVAGADLAADTSFDATVTGTDGAGNPFSATTTSIHTVDTSASATISVDSITADDIVNAAEAGAPINITGSVGGDAAPGDTVSFTINGTNYSGTVAAGNTFIISVAGADLAADTSFDATVTGTDGAGNPFSAITTSSHSVDTTTSATISVDNITADDVVNAAEAGASINVTGTVGGDAALGDTVSFTVNGTNYSGSVLAGNTFSIAVAGSDMAADTSFDASVTGTDGAGNPFSATTTSIHAVDTSASATISVDAITADDIVNAAETGTPINVTGSVGGDAAPGDTVSFTVNGTNYSGSVLAGNTFSIAVAGADLAADTSFDATVTGTDTVGNPFSATTTSTHTVDTTASATITVNNITADDIVNAAEAAGSINVTGSVGGDAAPGDTVSFTINGTNYSGSVLAGNTFSIAVAGADLAADTSFDATVTGSDGAGNPFSATTTSTHTVDTGASASIAIDIIAGDDIINALESGNDLDITGTVTGDAESGDTVVINIGGTDYSTTVNADNITFSVTVPAVDVGSLSDGIATATVSGTDSGGNTFSVSSNRGYTLDTTASATISVDAITADDIVNAAEAGAPINVTGSIGGDAAPGDTVSFTINGTNYSGSVLAGNTFSISVAGADLAADTSFDATVTGSDTAGNPFSATTTSTHSVDTTASATISVDAITADDIVNAAEAGAPINVTGSVGGDAAPGDTVSFTVNGTNYSGNVLAGNTFSISVAGADLAADTSFDATVSGTDTAGNPFSATTTSTHSVDTTASATISVDNITADDIVNAAEAGTPINVNGSVGGDAAPGDTVSFTVNGTNYSGTVAAGNTFSINVAGADLAADTSFDATVTGTDGAGNPFSATTTSTHTVDTTASATISVDAITADDVVNAAEAGAPINVTGAVGGDAAPGDTVSFTINGTNYSGTVAAGNTFSISVDGADLAADTSFDATVTGTDGAGNTFSATTTSIHNVDTSASATITVDNITADDIVNAAEAGAPINVTGTVGGDAAPGDTVSFTVNGTNYSGTVAVGNTFTISVAGADLAADTSFDATVAGTDGAGNPFSATTTSTHSVDTSASATITVDNITADDIVNAVEAAGSVNVTGSVGGDAAPGDSVSFTINGTNYSGSVLAGNTFSISVAGADLAADMSFDATVTGTDGAGNPFSSTTTSTHSVDTTASATISVDAITADDVVNATEAGAPINVTGTVGGDAAPGDTVSFAINGTNYSGNVLAGNTFSIAVAGADLAADTGFDATVTGTDGAGNPFSATTTSTHSVDTTASATISVDAITADDIVNAAEAGGAINVTGTVGGDAAPGDIVSFTVNGTNYSGSVLAGNTFSVSVAGSDLAADTSFDATVTGTDGAGNSFSATTTSTHSVDTTASATISVDAITADDIVNAAEAGAPVDVTGSVGGDAAPGDTVSFTINGTNYSGSVLAGNTFSIAVAGADLAADTSFDATVTGTDGAGNPFSSTTTSTHSVDTTASATISVDTITADDVVNAAEAGAPINVTGTVGGDAAPGDTVSFTINGTNYSGNVQVGNTFNISVGGADLAADTSFDATVIGSDAAGNPFSATTTSTHSVDTTASASISVDAITADDVVNAVEAAGSVNVTGTVGGDAAPGDSVSFTVNGTNYSGTVAVGNTFTISVAGADLAADTSFDATVTGSDAAGNPFSATTTSTHTVDTAASATISVDAITADDVVNAAEAGGSINVTGSVGGDAAPGDTVSFMVNGTNYSGSVLAGNTFNISVAGADLAADTSFDATVIGSDGAGNPFSATATSTHSVDTTASATISIDAITADDVVNAAEAGAPINVTGTVGGDAAPGDTVSFTVNGTNYSGSVLAGNTFSISVAGADLAADTSFDATVTGTDTAGNPFSATTTSTHSVDTAASATISVDAITADDVVNAAEAGSSINVTGSVGGDAAPGDTVSFTVNGTNYSGSVLAGNTFSISVAGADLSADTSFDATVTGTDGAGNPFSATTTSTHTVDTAASATISVDAITADDIVNAAEAGSPINVTGSVGGDAAPGDTVSFTINGTNYSGTVAAGNTFSISVAGADLAADTSFDATVTGSDAAGNPFSASTTSTHSVDTTASATVTVDNITADDIVNAVEASTPINVTGTVGGDAAPGDTVSFTINGNNYSGSVLAGNTFSITVAGADLAADTSFDVTVTGSDTAGNPFTSTVTSTHSVDTSASATISVDAITADDIVNAAEAGAPINVSGTVGGDAAPGDTVSLTINGTNYSGGVLAGNTFSISVDGADLAADTSFDATVTGTDGAGNPFSATTTSTHSVDTTASATISVDNITADDIVNAAEAGTPINITGSVGGDAAPGDTVSFTINGTNYSGSVLVGNTFSISVAGADLAADTSFDATVTGSDAAGNPFTSTVTSTHSVDTSASATITVDNITADDIVNAAEAGAPINVTGSVGGDAAPGDTVSFTVNGTNYSGTVAVGNTFTISVAGADLAADTSFDATVTGTDGAGNPFSATTTSIHTVDTTASATISVDAITVDDIVNAAEAGAPINVTGTVGGDAAPGDTVSFTINGTNYSGSVLAGNTFSIAVAGADLAADTSFDATVTGTDGAGNPFSATTTSTHNVDTSASATITVDNITADDIVNAAEAAGSVNVTGSVGGDAAPGDSVSFTINGTNYSGSVLAGNTFSISVDGADLAADNSFDATVTGSDASGNPFSSTTTSTHSVDTTASATISVDTITADDVVNAAEAGAPINVTGTVGGDAAPGDTVSFTINGTNYSGTVAAGNTFSISVAGADLAADTSFDVTVTGSDTAGNPFTSTVTSTHSVDTSASATISVDAITADDIVNAAEAAGSVNVTGSVGGDAAPGDTVSFTINGTNYSGSVLVGNTFSISVAGADLAADTSFDATVTGTDSAGNPFTSTVTSTHTVDTTSSATISVDNITADDIVNAAEAGSPINVTGSVGGDAAPGDTVSFTINGTNYSGTVAAGNTFSISVAGADLAADTSFDATVTGSDAAGNPFSASTTSTHSVDTTASATVTVDNITADDIVNAVEASTPINVTGTVGGDAAPGDTVSFTINGNNYSGSVLAGNTFSITVAGADLAADTSFDVTVTGSDTAGNPFTSTVTSTHSVDTSASATISVDAITADDIVNAIEAGAPINVTGTVGGDAAPGDTVSFTINGTNYSGTVAAGNTFSISVAGADLAADTSFDTTVTGNDAAGNPFSATTTSTHSVDTSASATISVDAITADDIVNAAEAGAPINITGTVGGDAAPGDTVSFTINGTNYSGSVLAGNTFSIAVAGSDLATDTSFDITVTGTDAAGNPFTSTVSSTHSVDTSASATISVDNITADDIVNAAEGAGSINVTGSVGGDAAPGDTVSFTINGTNYSGSVLAGNTFSISVSGSDLAADTSFDATVTGTDTAGNPFSATTTSTHTVSPILDLDANNSSGSAGAGYTTTFTEGGTAVAIADIDINITDQDSAQIQSATIIVTDFEAGDLLNVGGLPAGISASAYNPATGSLTLTGGATLADYQTAIRAIQFTNDGSSSASTRSVDISVSDGTSSSNIAVTTINVVTLPTVSITDVSVQEPAAGTTTLIFTISLDQSLASDLTFDYNTADISALAGADYVGISSTTGTIIAGATTTTVTVTVNSDANNFEGDETFSIDLANFNQTVNFASGSHTIAGGVQGIGTIGANNGAPDAIDDSYITLQGTPLIINSLLDNDSLVDGAVLTGFTQGANGSIVDNGDGTYTYTPTNPTFTGTDTFTYTLTDADGETDTATVTVTVSNVPVNPPVVSSVPDTAYTENDSPTQLLSGVSISDIDSTNLSSVVVRIEGYIGAQDSLNFLTAGTSVAGNITVSGNTWELTLTGGATINEYQQVLGTLEYENISDNPSSATRTVTVEAYDDAYNNLFGTSAGSLTIAPVNDAPDVFDNDSFSVASVQDNALNITAPTDADTDDSVLVITVTGIPTGVGTVTLVDGTPVNVNDVLTLAQLTTLQFDAGAVDGADVFTYTVFDGTLTTVGTTTINVGSSEPDINTVYESAMPDGSGIDGGSNIASGNLFANDAAASGSTTLDSIDFNAVNFTPDGSGIISIITTLGTLTVYADNTNAGYSAGDYIYTLDANDTTSTDVSESFTYHFTSGTPQQDTLTISIIDDVPVANDLVETIPESEEKVFNIIFTLDDSGSMAWGAVTGSTNPPATEATRMEIAQESLAGLAAEYFNQSTQVTVTLITFNSTASFVGTYTDFTSFETALYTVTPGGGTNYVDATDEIQNQFAADLATQNPADDVQNVSYFISDGEANAGTSPIGSGYIEYVNTNSIDSYSVGIGSSLPGDLSDLNYIHNIDSLGQGSGHVDDALIVADVSQLEAELLSTVPTAFGGNIVANGSIQNLSFGADGGYVQSIDMDLGSPATTYTFSFDGSTISVSPALPTIGIDGSRLTLNSDDGFDYGTFIFDFGDGSYSFVAPNGTAEATFTFDYTIIDGDGDTASATATIDIVDDSPDAHDDLHSVDAYETAAGNVITAIGTDGGPTYGGDFTPFATQGGGVDKIVDDAVVTGFEFRGSAITLDLTMSTTTIMPPDPTGSSDNVAINNSTNFAATDFSLSSTSGVGFNNNGAGISGGRSNSTLDNQDGGVALTITFDNSVLPYGVDNLVLGMNDYQSGNNDAVTLVLYDATGGLIATVGHSAASGTNIDLSAYSGIASLDMTYTGGGADAQLDNITYDPTPASLTTVTTLDQTGGDNGSNLSWVYSHEVDIDGNDIFQATVTDSDDGSSFIMRSNGYYNFTPDQSSAPSPVSVNPTSQANVDASDISIAIRAGGATLQYSADGVGVAGGSGTLLSSGEALLVTFDGTALPNGVNNLMLTLNDFQSANTDQATVIVTHDSDKDGTLTTDTIVFSASGAGTEILDLSQFSGVTQFDIEYTGGGWDLGLGNISYQDATTTISNLEPDLINYTLTDTDGQSDTAQLAIYTIDQTITGTIGADNIMGGALNEAIKGDAGDDILSGGAGHDTLAGGAGADTLSGNTGNDYLSGGDNNDSLFGGAGNDYLDGDAGNDLVDGGTGDDIVQGGDGDDQLYGGAGNDKLEGEAGYDLLVGGAGDDSLFGGSGIDILNGGTGNDLLSGGEDIDTFVWSSGNEGTEGTPASDVITDFTAGVGGDVLNLGDMLQGENTGNLTDYLHFESDGSGGTLIKVDTDGGGTFAETQTITLTGIDLTVGGTLTDQNILDGLLADGNLIVD